MHLSPIQHADWLRLLSLPLLTSPPPATRTTSSPLSPTSRRCTSRSTGPSTSSWWTCCCTKPSSLPTRSTASGLQMRRSSFGYTGAAAAKVFLCLGGRSKAQTWLWVQMGPVGKAGEDAGSILPLRAVGRPEEGHRGDPFCQELFWLGWWLGDKLVFGPAWTLVAAWLSPCQGVGGEAARLCSALQGMGQH